MAKSKSNKNRRVAPEKGAEERPAVSPTLRWVVRHRAAVVAAGVLLTLVLVYAVDRVRYRDRIARGVSISGLSVARMTADEATQLVVREGDARLGRPLAVQVRASRFELAPSEMGVTVDPKPAVDQALAVGRTGNPLTEVFTWIGSLWGTREISPVATIDEARLGERFDAWEQEAIDDGPFLGAVVVEGTEPKADYPRPGWIIDRATAVERVKEALAARSEEAVEIPLVRQVPPVAADVVDRAVTDAKALVGGPVVLEETPASFEARTAALAAEAPAPEVPKKKKKKDAEPAEADAGPKPWRLELTPADLLGALRSRPVTGATPGVELFFDPRAFKERLDAFSRDLEEPAVDARFLVDTANNVTITPSRAGNRVDAEAVATAALAAARDPQRLGALPVQRGAEPSFTDEDAQALGIVGLVAQFSTRHACCQPRVTNIHRIADMLNGVIVRPGETFSVNELVGARTEERGFVKAPGIEDGEMKDSLGGGISQFATTLFNAVLEGGYDIVERQPHSFYFQRYPIGHEATLSYPKPDLIFKNDSAAGMLIVCDYDKTWIKVRLFGDVGGRKVKKKVSQIFDVTEPETEYEPNDRLSPDDEEVKEEGADGWSVTVTRLVEFPDGTSKEESRKVTYKPRPRVVEVHSCKIPKKKKGYTGKRCPETEDPDDPDEDAHEGEGEGEVAEPVPMEGAPEGEAPEG